MQAWASRIRGGGWWNGETRRYPWALLAGVLLGLAHPTPGLAGLAWVAPGILLFAGLGLAGGPAFRVGLVAGLGMGLISLRWLLHIPDAVGSVAGWLALSGYVGVYPGIWLALVVRVMGGRASGWRDAVNGYAGIPWRRRVLLPMVAAAMWVGLEMVRARLMGGFPWSPLGVTQWRQVPLLQMAAWTGAYGVSFVVCWASVALIGACVAVVLRPRDRSGWLAEARLPLFAVLICVGLGFFRVLERRRAEVAQPPEEVRLALIQPAIPQTVLWDEDAWGESFGVMDRLTRAALVTGPEMVIWPEGSFGLVRTNFEAMSGLLLGQGVGWIFCETDFELGDGGGRKSYNAAFMTGADGRVTEVYRKRRLVPFGEFVPLVRWLPFMRYLTPIGDGFTAGDGVVRFEWERREGGGRVRMSPIICFEDVFPHGIREHTVGGVDFLLELTNNAWFGESGAHWQHLANAVLRAVENQVAVVRCTNNGVTCWVDELGAVREVLGEGGARVYREGFLTVGIPVGQGRAGSTWYAKNGDVFGWVCGVLGLVWVLRGWRGKAVPMQETVAA